MDRCIAFHRGFHRGVLNIGGKGREGVAQLTQEYEQLGDHYSPALHQLVARMLVVEPSQRLDLAAALRPGMGTMQKWSMGAGVNTLVWLFFKLFPCVCTFNLCLHLLSFIYTTSTYIYIYIYLSLSLSYLYLFDPF